MIANAVPIFASPVCLDLQFHPISYIFVGMPQLDSKIRGCHLLLGRHQSQIERLGFFATWWGWCFWPRIPSRGCTQDGFRASGTPASQKKNAALCGQHGYGWMEWRNWVDTCSEWIRSIYLTAKKTFSTMHMVPSPTTRWHCVWHGPWHTIVGSWGCRPTAFRFMSLAWAVPSAPVSLGTAGRMANPIKWDQ